MRANMQYSIKFKYNCSANYRMIKVLKIKNKLEKDQAFKIRNDVFVIEQQVDPSEEYDPEDEMSTHFIAYYNDIPCGTCRWRFKEIGVIKLERFAVLKEFRGYGIGQALAEACINDLPYNTKTMLHAQTHAVDFYKKIDFETYGEEFEEAGINHFAMKLIK